MRLVVGLGNPGSRYAGTRHNAGFFVVDELARRHQVDWRGSRDAESARWGPVRLVKPTTYMNLSGAAVQAAATRAGIAPPSILVIHDDIDLPLGRLRLKRGGGAGGQRGVRDIMARLGEDFLRLKVGVDRPPPEWPAHRWVLSRFRPEEAERLDAVVDAAADGVELLLAEGFEAARERINATRLEE